jgi:hypothetical protein
LAILNALAQISKGFFIFTAMSKESHSFNVSVACEVGVNCAIILQHFIFLQRFSPDGWVKKSAKAIKETYPYMTEKEVRGAIESLCRQGHVFDKIENAVKADRTKSFFVSDSGHKLYDTEPFDKRANGVPKRANGFDKMENDKLPKGQMLIKEDYIVNSNIVESDAPAPEVQPSTLNTPFRELPAGAGAAGPHIRDFVNADTPSQMIERIHAFYATEPGQREKEVIYANTLAGKMSDAQRTDVVQRFAAWAVRENYGQRTFRELNSQFFTWWKNQTRFHQPAAGAAAHQNARSEGPTLRSTDQNPYARHKIIS